MNPSTAKPKSQLKNSRLVEQYQRAQIETASPTRLVVLLYDGAIRFCSQAIEAMEAGNREAQNHSLLKAQRILSELIGSLDRKVGGEIADNLLRLYTFLYEQLVRANLNDSQPLVNEVLTLLRELRESWNEIDRQSAQNASSGVKAEAGRPPGSTVSPVATAIPRLEEQRV